MNTFDFEFYIHTTRASARALYGSELLRIDSVSVLNRDDSAPEKDIIAISGSSTRAGAVLTVENTNVQIISLCAATL